MYKLLIFWKLNNYIDIRFFNNCIDIRYHLWILGFLLELNDRGKARYQTRAIVTPSQMHYQLYHLWLDMELCCIMFCVLIFCPTGSPQRLDIIVPPTVNQSKKKKFIKVAFARTQQASLETLSSYHCFHAERQAGKL